jgi:hypothetical protein
MCVGCHHVCVHNISQPQHLNLSLQGVTAILGENKHRNRHYTWPYNEHFNVHHSSVWICRTFIWGLSIALYSFDQLLLYGGTFANSNAHTHTYTHTHMHTTRSMVTLYGISPKLYVLMSARVFPAPAPASVFLWCFGGMGSNNLDVCVCAFVFYK